MSPDIRDTSWSTILFADLVGFSMLMGKDEIGTLEFVADCSKLANELASRHNGCLVQTTGDGFLLIFERPNDALNYGIGFHKLISKRQTDVEVPAQFRIGIHCGQVHRTSVAIGGHAVNIAARLEGVALPGTCVISGDVYDRLNKADYELEYIGTPPLKNINERVRLHRTLTPQWHNLESSSSVADVSVVGGLILRVNDTVLKFHSGQYEGALLGYLSLANRRFEKNEEIIELLWPDMDTPYATELLNGCLEVLEGKLGEVISNLLLVRDGRIGLSELHFETDLAQISANLARGEVEPLLYEHSDWPNRILEGFDQASPVFAAWMSVIRNIWKNRILTVATKALSNFGSSSDVCHDIAKTILALEPGNEVASAALIEYFASRGNRSAAICEFNRLKEHLASQHGLEPSRVIQSIFYDSAADGFAQPPGKTETAVSNRLLRIAVTPFSTNESTSQYIISGFRTSLISNLSRFREWSIVEDRAGVPEGVDRAADNIYDYTIGTKAIGDRKIRLVVRDASDNRLIWHDDVRLDTNDWNTTQRWAVGRIAAHLKTYISADRLTLLIDSKGSAVTIHDSWLQAEQIFARWTPEASDEAERILRQLIRTDPNYAPAYSSLASFYNVRHVIRPGAASDANKSKEAHRLAQRSVEIDPLDARNQLAVAWSAAMAGYYDRAAIHLDMAESLNPNDPTTLISCAMGYAFIGQTERGELLIDHTLRIIPKLSEHQWCYVSAVHFLSKRYEEAIYAAKLSGDRIVDNQGWIAATLVKQGKIDEAKAAFDLLIESVRPIWSGPNTPTAEAVYDWFIAAYPIRNDADRAHLTDSLLKLVYGQ